MSESSSTKQNRIGLHEALERAVACYQQGKFAESESLVQQIIALRPYHFDAHHLIGIIRAKQGDYADAINFITAALRENPNSAEAQCNLGVVLWRLERHEDALMCFEKALTIKPNYAEAFFAQGSVLKALGRHDQALENYDRAVAIRPNYLEALNNRGNVLRMLDRYHEALESYDEVLASKPDNVYALNNYGVTLVDLNMYQEAMASYDKVLAIKSDDALTLKNRGVALGLLNRHDEAIASYDKALTIKSDDAEVHFFKGMACLLMANFANGWEEYEWRWKTKETIVLKRDFAQPLWLGQESLSGKTILLHPEQGFGDTIMAARYVPRIAKMGAKVILEVAAPLKSLLSQIQGVSEIVAKGEALPVFDVHCPLMSLPLACSTTLESIPVEVPYLAAPQDRIAEWGRRLGDAQVPRIGIVWSGNQHHKNDRNRSISLQNLSALCSPDFQLVSLQKELREGDEDYLREHPYIQHFGEQVRDFADTAALISLMDLIVSVDTSVAHLAGAMGKPVWILLSYSPDWRWLLDREDSPWYPTARLFRQPAIGDWDSIVTRVREELRLHPFLRQNHQLSKPLLKKQESEGLQQILQRAVVFQQQRRLTEAEQLYQQILRVKPDHFDALHLLGVLRHQEGRNAEALELICAALQKKPNEAVALSNYGVVLSELERFDEALASYEKALAIKPDDAEVLYNRGKTFSNLNRYKEAIASYDHALALRPNYTEALFNRGNILRELKRYEEALSSYDKVLAIKPKYVKALFNRGILLQVMRRFDKALTSLNEALSIKPDYAEALNARGFALQALNRHDEAIVDYDSALAKDATFAQAHHNRSMALLLKGDFVNGLPEYEWRWETGHQRRQEFRKRHWLGKEQIAGKTIVLHGEQGFGDIIMTLRYVPHVMAMNAKVILAAPPPLIPLLKEINGVQQIFGPGEALPPFNLHCPFMSLPLALSTTLQTIPGKVPYLAAPQGRVTKWQDRLGVSRLPRIGIVWSGSEIHKNDHNRSIDLQRFCEFSSPVVQLVSLQRELRPKDQTVLQEHAEILHFGEEIRGFADTAALISLVDLIISVDTSVAHLAGAMGKPIWILLPYFPDWRWLLDREDSPWYPTARLFRQSSNGDWDSVVARVKKEIGTIFNA